MAVHTLIVAFAGPCLLRPLGNPCLRFQRHRRIHPMNLTVASTHQYSHCAECSKFLSVYSLGYRTAENLNGASVAALSCDYPPPAQGRVAWIAPLDIG